MCDVLVIAQNNIANPFRDYVLPLAYKSAGVLYAVLNLSARHHSRQAGSGGRSMATLAEEHSFQATEILDNLLKLEHLSHRAQVSTLIMVLFSVLQDVRICPFERCVIQANLS